MSGTYQLDSQLFPKNPIGKRWTPGQQVGRRGTREPIFASIWRFEMSFGALETQGQSDFFETRFLAGGLYKAILPHPITGNLTGFTGVAIENYSFEFDDVDREFWATSAGLVLSLDIRATGSV